MKKVKLNNELDSIKKIRHKNNHGIETISERIAHENAVLEANKTSGQDVIIEQEYFTEISASSDDELGSE